jgi:pimeloyl-ACP methyl ester carboxylesterase
MAKFPRRALFAAALLHVTLISPAAAQADPETGSNESISLIKIDDDITLRRMVAHSPKPKGVILLLHGFPETLYAWEGVSRALADEFEVHAFDWPGYGLSSRPTADRFAYAPSDYARVLKGYIKRAGIDSSKLTIYATDIGALPALLLAMDEPKIARQIIVGDFAPFDRPQYMHERLQRLKVRPGSDVVRAQLNGDRDDTLSNAFRRGLPSEAQFELSTAFKDDMRQGWSHGSITSADAFFHYYSHFTRDQHHFEANSARVKTPVKVVWGEIDPYISKEMGAEFATRVKATLTLLPGIGHYPHLQNPTRTVAEIRAAAR